MKNKEKQFRAGDVSECWRVVRLIGRKQISVRIILHNSEFLLPGHVVSGCGARQRDLNKTSCKLCWLSAPPSGRWYSQSNSFLLHGWRNWWWNAPTVQCHSWCPMWTGIMRSFVPEISKYSIIPHYTWAPSPKRRSVACTSWCSESLSWAASLGCPDPPYISAWWCCW